MFLVLLLQPRPQSIWCWAAHNPWHIVKAAAFGWLWSYCLPEHHRHGTGGSKEQ